MAPTHARQNPETRKSYRTIDTARSKRTINVAPQMIEYMRKDLSTKESSRNVDPITILVQRSSVPEDLKKKSFANPSDADILGEEYNLEMFRVDRKSGV